MWIKLSYFGTNRTVVRYSLVGGYLQGGGGLLQEVGGRMHGVPRSVREWTVYRGGQGIGKAGGLVINVFFTEVLTPEM